MVFVTENRITIAAVVGVPCIAALWLLTSGTTAVPSTYVFVALVAVAMAFVGLNTWNNGQATGSMAQVIHQADITPSTELTSTTVEQARVSRWDMWQSRGDALAHTGRIRALLALSIAVTGAVLFYVWLT